MNNLKSAVAMLITLAPFVVAPAGEAATYEWVDDAGVVHFTDDQGRIPAKYLKRAKELNSGSHEDVKSPAAPVPQAAPSPAFSPERKVVKPGGYREGYWRSKFASLRGEIKKLEESLPAMKEELNKLNRKKIVYGRASDRVARGKAAQAVTEAEERIKLLQEELKTLEYEASQADVPSEWRR